MGWWFKLDDLPGIVSFFAPGHRHCPPSKNITGDLIAKYHFIPFSILLIYSNVVGLVYANCKVPHNMISNLLINVVPHLPGEGC